MERVVIESKRELLVETLNKQVAEYKKKTGINLAGKSVKEIYSKATAEYNKLYEEINAEYETQKKVVDCIESGDINEAKRLLGMDVDAESETEEEAEIGSVEEAVEELEVGDGFELEVEDSEDSDEEAFEEADTFEDLEEDEDEGLEDNAAEVDEAEDADDGFADLEIEEIDLDDLSVEPEEVEVKEEPKKTKKTKKGMDNPFDKTDDIFELVEKAEEKKAGAKKVDEKKTEEKKVEKKAKAEPKKVEEGVESLADFFEDDDEILDFADGIDGLSLDFN